jgi:hypothetical protein
MTRRDHILWSVLYRYENWSLTLSEENGLRVFENKAMKITCGPKGGGGERERESNRRVEKIAK